MPHNDEWDELLDYLVTQGYPRDVYNSSGFLVEEGSNGLPMMTTSGWFTNNGTDEFGFAAKPAGYIGYQAGENQLTVSRRCNSQMVVFLHSQFEYGQLVPHMRSTISPTAEVEISG